MTLGDQTGNHGRSEFIELCFEIRAVRRACRYDAQDGVSTECTDPYSLLPGRQSMELARLTV